MGILITDVCSKIQSGANRLRRSFARAKSGATALEFALIAAPLFALLIAIFETGLLFVAQQYLQTATTQTARLIMTGQAQDQGLTAAQFQKAVCANAPALFNCSGIYVNVQTFSSFSGVTTSSPLTTKGAFDPTKMNFSAGAAGDIELVQVYYQWPVIIAPLGFNISNMSGNYNLLVGTAVFRNEPFQ